MKTENALRVALVGCGSLGRVHASNMQGMAGIELTAICDANEDSTAQLAGQVKPTPNVYSDHRRMLDRENLDALLIVTPNSSHRAITIDAAEAGVHIFCEKPMAITLDECDEMIEAVRRSKVHWMIGYMRRFQPCFAKMKEIVDGGGIGDIRLINTVRMQGITPGGGAEGWQYTRTGYGGLYSLYSHEMDQMRWLTGEISAVEAVMNYGDNPAIDIEDSVFLALEFASGAIGSLGCTRISPTRYFTFVVVGTKGCITTDDYNGKGPLYVTYEGSQTAELVMPESNEYARELEYFFSCLREGIAPEPGLSEGRRVVEIGVAAYEAAQSGRKKHV